MNFFFKIFNGVVCETVLSTTKNSPLSFPWENIKFLKIIKYKIKYNKIKGKFKKVEDIYKVD